MFKRTVPIIYILVKQITLFPEKRKKKNKKNILALLLTIVFFLTLRLLYTNFQI